MTDRTNIVLISTGRTGTKLISTRYQNRPDILVEHASKGSTVINIVVNGWLAGLVPGEVVRYCWRRIKGGSGTWTDSRPLYLDSNNHLYALTRYFPGLIDNLKVVHVVRDPRDYIVSHLNWAYSRRKSYLANFAIPFWQPNGWLLGEYSLSDWLRLDRLQRYAWIWTYKNRIIGELADMNIPYFRMRLEDYLVDPRVRKSLDAFLGVKTSANEWGLEESSRKVNASSARRVAHWRHWPQKDLENVEQICGSLMREYGYELMANQLCSTEVGN